MKRGHETCIEPTTSPRKRAFIIKPQIHPFLLSKPSIPQFLQGLWLACGRVEGQVTLVNAECRSSIVPVSALGNYRGLFVLYLESNPDIEASTAFYDQFARVFLWNLPQCSRQHFHNLKRLRLQSVADQGSLMVFTQEGETILAREEATVPFLVLKTLGYSLTSWSIVLERNLYEISSLADFRLERM